jgi:hypothetical protein
MVQEQLKSTFIFSLGFPGSNFETCDEWNHPDWLNATQDYN